MSILDLSPDEVLVRRAGRKRLDLLRPVETTIIRLCLEFAVQAVVLQK